MSWISKSKLNVNDVACHRKREENSPYQQRLRNNKVGANYIKDVNCSNLSSSVSWEKVGLIS